MRLYIQILRLLFAKFILRQSNGAVIKHFAQKMGVVYIKLAQILATQNYGTLFTEQDRQLLSSICDQCNPIDFVEIEAILRAEYGDHLWEIFRQIDPQPVGSASVSQVHHAVLKTGEEVAIKIKRRDITATVVADIERIRRLVRRFGRLFHFRNFTGSDHALDLYLDWIRQETDFINEQHNIQIYQDFADNVNGRVPGARHIRLPHLYPEYSTANIIVMEFITAPTINRLELTPENKSRIATAVSGYIQASFWAMFHDQPIVFHGDPPQR